jgi:hypothetical protein
LELESQRVVLVFCARVHRVRDDGVDDDLQFQNHPSLIAKMLLVADLLTRGLALLAMVLQSLDYQPLAYLWILLAVPFEMLRLDSRNRRAAAVQAARGLPLAPSFAVSVSLASIYACQGL